ncbi:MAG: ABC transporter permease subunit [Reyranella sp.]|jgi:ABC-2 type transport system permease protein|uniref:ABC transporter permease n=1 Tax=Reyranella sp. TaxID=1929291 RepID=UPI001AD3C205|nr:ABC transporter permease subunit [Reyranella sp.]MBN9536487.1 ABC transporter permease subunit [Alphaproteobacteria bacterium]MBR2819146.1 ABC transporter permease subunit [Reyranella sp.]
MPRSATPPAGRRREGSPFTGLGAVFMKEFADHLSSARMMVLMLFVIVFGAFPVATSLQTLRTVVDPNSFIFLRIFTLESEQVGISFTAALNFIIPLMAIGLGFDAVNSEFNRRTLSRVLSQPIYRDALLLGKFLGGLATLAVALVALWLIVLGAGLLLLGVPPRGVEVARGLSFLLVAIAYGGVWLAIAMLFSVIFRSTATSALCALGVWLFFFILWPQLAGALLAGLAPSEIRSLDEYVAVQSMGLGLMRLSPGTLFSEAVLGLLSPETRSLGPMLPSQMRGAIMGAPLPFDQSVLLIWPQVTGLVAGMIVVFAVAYVIFQREEVRA